MAHCRRNLMGAFMLKPLLVGAGFVLATALPAAAACTDIASKTIALSGCIDSEWQPLEGSGAQEFLYQTADGNFALMVVTEAESFPMGQFRDAILKNAVTGSGAAPEDVTVVGERVVSIDDKPFNVIEYQVPLDDNLLRFQNFYYSAAGLGAVQILAYSLDSEASAAAYRAGVFAATVKLGG